MSRLWRVIVIASTALATIPLAILIMMWMDWRANCAPGRAAVSGYTTNDCGDIQSVMALAGPPALLLMIPLAILVAARLRSFIRA